jgi:AcrR family transcriptional regulator
VAAASPRRTHAQRTAETRQRVMTAVVESIAEVGYQKTTASQIARRAGVTWGAVQHHFGDKDGILMAVLEESFERFAGRFGDVPETGSLEVRVSAFVDSAWAHFSSSHYRSTFEILLNLPSDLDLTWQREVLKTWNGIWSRHFPDHRLRGRQTLDLMHYAVSVLTGLAATGILAGKGPRSVARELGFLKETLTRGLAAARC